MTFVNYFLRYITISLLFLVSHVNAQDTEPYKYPPSNVVTIHSKVLNEDRKIYVHCPKPDTANPTKRYPVLYLTDADNYFELLAFYTGYLSRWDVLAMPEMIVVATAHADRIKDLTPTHGTTNYLGKRDTAGYYKTSGGNENFLQFIRTELMPVIERNYKTEPYKILGGHSFGGITTINCMLTHPEMFNAYIAISPSFYWDNRYLLKLTDKILKKSSVLNKKLFYSNGNEGEDEVKPSFFHTDVLTFDSLITSKKLIALDYTYKYYPTETHMTEPIVAYFDALRFIFKDWEKHQ